MKSKKQMADISRFLSLVLRHKPETIGIHPDKNGWTDAIDLIEKVNNYGISLDRELLDHIVETNSKKRFAFNETKDRIRASQGHSIEIDLGYKPVKPPDILYHGTGENAVHSIMESGIEKRNRQHVHLSSDPETAIQVGQRHGKAFVFNVLAGEMFNDNYEFFISENGVWLTEHVPAKYIQRKDG
jgi:putative RNA 2'-phosphotransferase